MRLVTVRPLEGSQISYAIAVMVFRPWLALTAWFQVRSRSAILWWLSKTYHHRNRHADRLGLATRQERDLVRLWNRVIILSGLPFVNCKPSGTYYSYISRQIKKKTRKGHHLWSVVYGIESFSYRACHL